MFTEICLGAITALLSILVIALVAALYQAKQSLTLMQTRFYALSHEMTSFSRSIHQFVYTDLRPISKEASQLLGKLTALSSDIHEKSHSLNFLFQPLGFLTNKLNLDSSSEEPDQKKETLPQILKWAISSAILFKTTKEFMKRYGKR